MITSKIHGKCTERFLKSSKKFYRPHFNKMLCYVRICLKFQYNMICIAIRQHHYIYQKFIVEDFFLVIFRECLHQCSAGISVNLCYHHCVLFGQ